MANNEKIEALNRLKVVLVEKGKTSRWLAEQLGKTEHTPDGAKIRLNPLLHN